MYLALTQIHTIFRLIVGVMASTVCVGQMFGIVLSLSPTLARAAWLTLLQHLHYRPAEELEQADVLRLLLQYAPLLTPLATCLPATLICQLFAPRDLVSSYLFLAFWVCPPLVVAGYRSCRPVAVKSVSHVASDRNDAIDSTSYLLFLLTYIALMISLILRVVAVNNWEQYLHDAVTDPSVWLTLVSSVLLTNVALSDLLGQLTESRAMDGSQHHHQDHRRGSSISTPDEDDLSFAPMYGQGAMPLSRRSSTFPVPPPSQPSAIIAVENAARVVATTENPQSSQPVDADGHGDCGLNQPLL